MKDLERGMVVLSRGIRWAVEDVGSCSALLVPIGVRPRQTHPKVWSKSERVAPEVGRKSVVGTAEWDEEMLMWRERPPKRKGFMAGRPPAV